MLRKQFGYRLQEVMENKKISYSDLAKKSDVSRDHIYHIVDGSKEVGIDTIEKLSDAHLRAGARTAQGKTKRTGRFALAVAAVNMNKSLFHLTPPD